MITGGTMDSLVGRLFNEKELDLGYELSELFSGLDFEKDKGIIFVHRKMNRDEYNKKEKCSCNSDVFKSGQSSCKFCDGVGYLWTEKFIKSYLYNERYISFTMSYSFTKSTGREFNEQYIFITEKENKLEEGDVLYELEKNDNGKIKYPFVAKIEYLITANRYMGVVQNKHEYTLAVGEIVNRNNYVGRTF